MESNNRKLWLFVIVVLLAMLCCCALVGGLALFRAGGSVLNWTGEAGIGQERVDQTFEVGESPVLQLDNFAGAVTVRPGERGEIRVVAVKKAPPPGNLSGIEIRMSGRDDRLVIETKKSSFLGNASVEFEIVVPADTYLDLHTGAGSIDVRGLNGGVKLDSGAGSMVLGELTGQIEAHSGAGGIEIDGAVGNLNVDTGTGSITMVDVRGEIEAHTGAGSIDIDGVLLGDCRFDTGVGSITLKLPADLSMEIDLGTGLGTVSVAYDVDGNVSSRAAKGTVGRGAEGSIYAHTGTGSIDLLRR